MSEINIRELKKITNIQLAAAAYMRAGFALTPLRPDSKCAYQTGWNQPEYRCKSDHWTIMCWDNIGVILQPSNLCVVDIDNKDDFKLAMQALPPEVTGWLTTQTAGISSGKRGKGKFVFTIPDGVQLKYHKLNWTAEDGKRHTVFELRCGYVQDVLPPSIHPDTHKQYRWVGGDVILEAPADLIALWQNWDTYEPAMVKANPNYVEPQKTATKKCRSKYVGQDYISMWKDYMDLDSILTACGYVKKGKRYLSPDSNSGIPGVVILDDGYSFYSHNESDYFADGRSHDAFDLLTHFRYNDDTKAAYRFVKEQLGVCDAPVDEYRTDVPLEDADISEAERIYKSGMALADLCASCNRIHIGDKYAIRAMFLSYASTHVRNCNGIHIALTGKAGGGKSDVVKTVLRHIPLSGQVKGKLSDKALFYHKFAPGTIFAFDDQSLSEDMQENLKNLNWDEPTRLLTVKNQDKLTLEIPPRCPFWVVKAEGSGDEQIMDRQVLFWIDDSPEQVELRNKSIYYNAAHPAEAQAALDYATVCTGVWDFMPTDVVVSIPFADRIRGGVEDARNINLFLTLIKANAVMCAPRRSYNMDGELVATEEDFHVAASVMNPLLQNKGGSQKLKLSSGAWKVLQWFAGKPSGVYTFTDIMTGVGISATSVSFALFGRNKDKTDGLSAACPAINIMSVADVYQPEHVGEQYLKRTNARKGVDWNLDAYQKWIDMLDEFTLMPPEDNTHDITK